MKDFFVKETHRTPKIEGAVKKGTLSIIGKSLPEDAKDFYLPFKEWLLEFFQSPSPKLTITIELEYFNTATSKLLVDMMINFEKIRDQKEVEVLWVYDEDDLEMEEVGGDFKLLLGDLITLKANPS
ncbi:MAG: DUF1987 domain-containing protein [Crocinitomicaceae bacterium]